jgi:hypothetical protein
VCAFIKFVKTYLKLQLAHRSHSPNIDIAFKRWVKQAAAESNAKIGAELHQIKENLPKQLSHLVKDSPWPEGITVEHGYFHAPSQEEVWSDKRFKLGVPEWDDGIPGSSAPDGICREEAELKAFITKQSGLLAWQVWKKFLHGLYAQHKDFDEDNFDLFNDRRSNFTDRSRYYWFDQVGFIHGTMMAGQGMIRINRANGTSFILPDPELVAGDSFAKPTSMAARPPGCAVVTDAIASINRKAKELLLSPEEQQKLREQKKQKLREQKKQKLREQREQEKQQAQQQLQLQEEQY